ncbi:MAG: tRNA pseudouridine(55) synthase TruB [Gammaproteobacteria bacterium]|nr:MAG: tRNA pseudouridine(55) synthase TruB [Gammaproteobacteria bacterium]
MGRRRQRRGQRVDGLLLLDKPVGLTSNAALQKAKRLFKAAKAGHTGSLDPLASGLLPICFGEATKVSGFLLDADKEYEVVLQFGCQTATGDREGEVVARSDARPASEAAFAAVLADFEGEIEQLPPMYSALKHEGRRLYELARAGRTVERQPRRVRIERLELLGFEPDAARLRVRCSKGTYVRTLVEDIARACGCLAHVVALRRTRVGCFEAGQMIGFPALEAAAAGGEAALQRLLRPVDAALADWPALELGGQQAYFLLQGHAVSGAAGRRPGHVRLYAADRRFLGIGEVLGDGRVAPRRLIRQSPADVGRQAS